MNTLLIYLLQASVSLALLFSVYWIFLRKETFFTLNRWYLLSIGALSLLIPLIPFEWHAGEAWSGWVVNLETVLITAEAETSSVTGPAVNMQVFVIAYLTGVTIFLLRLLFQVVQLFMIVRKAGIRNLEGRRLVMVDRGYAPFSFLHLIFIREEELRMPHFATILAHEEIHVDQRHTLDLIFSEILIIILWFNPFTWLTARELKTIHEYLADEGVLRKGISPSEYRQLILNETMGIQVNQITNTFNVSLLKKRIVMMTKSPTARWMAGKALAALPVVALIALFLTARAENISIIRQEPAQKLLADSTKKNQQAARQIKENTSPEKEVFTKVEVLPQFNGGQKALQEFMIANIKYPEEAKKKGIKGTVFVTFVVQADGKVTDAKVLRGIGAGCDEEALRVVKMMPPWKPGLQKGKPVNVIFNLPVKFDLQKKEQTAKP